MAEIPASIVGRDLGATALEVIQYLVAACVPRTRSEIARRLCQRLGWITPSGPPALMSARGARLRLPRAGWIALPSAKNGNGTGRRFCTPRLNLRPQPVAGALERVPPVVLEPVQAPQQSTLWNQRIAQYHYLGHATLPGAQIRLGVYLGDQPAGALGFGAAAWRVAARDPFIGWTDPQRHAQLHRSLNNARFVRLPWVRVPHLASPLLGLCARRLPEAFQARYGWAPVLLERFVEAGRFSGMCYRAANWVCVGQTCGRGKKGPQPEPGKTVVPVKHIWLRPLRKDFRRGLCAGPPRR